MPPAQISRNLRAVHFESEGAGEDGGQEYGVSPEERAAGENQLVSDSFAGKSIVDCFVRSGQNWGNLLVDSVGDLYRFVSSCYTRRTAGTTRTAIVTDLFLNRVRERGIRLCERVLRTSFV